jgi:hypothetical protein
LIPFQYTMGREPLASLGSPICFYYI